MDELVATMRVTLGEELAKADWLSPETKKQALAKLDKITPKIGYPSKWKNYSSIEVTPGDTAGECPGRGPMADEAAD